MKRDSRNSDEVLRRFLGRYGSPSEEQIESEIDRAWSDLQANGGRIVEENIAAHPSNRFWRLRNVALAGALVAAAVVAAAIVRTPDAAVEKKPAATRVEPELPFGKVIRSGEANDVLVLADRSRIEMRSGTELVLEKAADGVRIRLNSGNIIVTAAEQKAGHLYVQTKDVTVSVVGTVFMVNAEESGSRVAVIQGEVEVQQGKTSKKLIAGDQVATGEAMQALPVAAKISWSPSAPRHLAMLEQNTASRTAAPTTLQFAVASVKPYEGNRSISNGFGCRGIDGKRFAPFGEGGAPQFVIPMGRCVGEGVSMGSLIAFAYGIPHRYGPNVPDWASTGTPIQTQIDMPDGRVVSIDRLRKARFQIDAVADSPATVTTEQLRQMVHTMLTDRFNFKSRREMQEAPGYVLSVGSTPPRLKEVSGDPEPFDVDMSNPGRPVLRGRSTVDELIVFLLGFTNPSGFIDGELPSYIVNKTGLKGIYEWALVLPIPGGGGRGSSSPGQTSPAPVRVQSQYGWRAPAMAEAVESQLGLRMLPQKVPVEVLVVEQIETPAPN